MNGSGSSLRSRRRLLLAGSFLVAIGVLVFVPDRSRGPVHPGESDSVVPAALLLPPDPGVSHAAAALEVTDAAGRGVAASRPPESTIPDRASAPELDAIDLELLARDMSGEKWDPPWEQFKSAESYASSRESNPGSVVLSGERMAELRALVAKLNMHMFRREAKTQALLDDYVKVKVEAGNAQPVPPGIEADWKALGDNGIRVVSGYGGLNHALIIHPGEFADLDQVMFERSALLRLGKERIAQFFNP